jgi:hypothetical protein
MNELVAAYPQRELHMIANTSDIHEPTRARWVRQRPQVDVHFSPIHALWLNQMGVWFSLRGHALRVAILTSVQRLVKRWMHSWTCTRLSRNRHQCGQVVRDEGT